MTKRLAEKILLIGWDGADWQIIRSLIAQGKMPALARLMKRGVTGNLATIQPVLSPMLWNSIATGKRADKHGIYGFMEPQPDRSGVRPVTSTSRKCKAFWNILSQSGLKSQVISWFASAPAEPIHGRIVSERFLGQTATLEHPRRCSPGTFHPPELAEELMPLIVGLGQVPSDALLQFIPRAAEIDQEQDDRLKKLASLVARTSTVQAAGCRLLTKEDWDLTAIYFVGIDEFGHTFMPYHPPRMDGVSVQDAAIYGGVMENCYRFHDMMLGVSLQLAGPDTTVILISDHGFKNDEQRPGIDGMKLPTEWHRAFGIACLAGPGVKQGETLYGATILDVTPTILALLGLPVAADMDGRPWLEIMEEPGGVERIASWEDVPGEAGLHSPDLREDPSEAAEAIKHLVDLGYIEAPSEDAEEAVRNCLRDQRTNLAVALSTSRRAMQAIPLWQELAQEFPDQPYYRYQLALVYRSLDMYEECQTAIATLPAEWQGTVEIQSMVARIALSRGDDESARLAIQAILAADYLDMAMLNQAGQLLMETDQWNEAQRVLERSLALLPENPIALDGLARLHLERDEFADAAECALGAASLLHHFPAAHFHLGLALRGLGKEEEAIQAFETSLAMGHNPADAHLQLASLYRTRDPQRAQLHARFTGIP